MEIDPRQLHALALRRSQKAFLHQTFLHLEPGRPFLDNWHIDAVVDRLDAVASSKGSRLILTMPPRSLKSIAVSVAWPAYLLGQDPTLKIICASYSSDLAVKLARDTRSVMQSDWYGRTYPGTVLVRTAENELTTTKGGGRLATSVGGTLRGHGADIMILDDIMKGEQTLSDVEARTAFDWYNGVASSRLNNKAEGAIVLVMQRLREDDLAGRLLEAGGWDHLKLAAIAPEDEEIPLADGRVHRRMKGQALHPAREPLAVLEAIRRTMGSAVFNAQYQQDPAPAGGALFKREWLAYYDREPQRQPGGLIVQSWDCASKEGALNDFSVCITAWVVGRRVYILDVQRARMDFPTLKRRAIELADRWRADVILIEDAASGTQLIQEMKAANLHHLPTPIAIRPDGDKVSRAAGAMVAMENHDILLPKDASWLAEFERELLKFPFFKHDDQVDALAHLSNWVRQRREPPSLGIPEVITISDDAAWASPPEIDYWDMVDGSGEDEAETPSSGIMGAELRLTRRPIGRGRMRTDEVDVRDAQGLRQFIDADDGRVAAALLQAADVLL